MTNIQLRVMGATATATVNGKITSGMVGLPVSIEYDESWAGLSRTAFFRAGNQTRKRTGVSDRTTVPWEILRNHSKRLEIGIEGRNASGDIVIPTVWATVCTISEGASGEILAAPLPNKEPSQGGTSIDDAIVSSEYTWSSKNTVDKLCPSFTKSGPAVTCEPVEGYPLTVQADDAAKVYRCGKNLLKPLTGTYTKYGVTIEVYEDGTFVVNGTATATASIDVAERVYVKEGVTYTLSGCAGGSFKTYQLVAATTGIIELYNPSAPGTSVAKGTGITSVRFYAYAGYPISNLVIKPQLELGATATARELHRGTEEFAPGEAVPALDGVNTIWADSGEVTVSGKADPVAVSRRQDERIAALEESLTALLEG